MSEKSILVIIKKPVVHDADGTVHRRKVLTVFININVVHSSLSLSTGVSHQRGGTTCKRRCPPPRSTNKIVHVGQCG